MKTTITAPNFDPQVWHASDKRRYNWSIDSYFLTASCDESFPTHEEARQNAIDFLSEQRPEWKEHASTFSPVLKITDAQTGQLMSTTTFE